MATPRTSPHPRPSFLALLPTCILLAPLAAGCMGGGSVLDRAAEAASGRFLERMETQLEESLGCEIDDEACLEDRLEASQQRAEGSAAETPANNARPGEGAWANFDFVPGSRILLADDFSTTPVGSFPASLHFVQGSLQVVEWQGQHLLESTGMSRFQVRLAEPLPERFTLEFDLFKGSHAFDETGVLTEPWGRSLSAYGPNYIHLGAAGQGVSVGFRGREAPVAGIVDDRYAREVVTIRVRVDGELARMYQNETRVANLPNAAFPRGEALEFRLRGSDDAPSYLTNLRIAWDEAPLEAQFAASGRLTLPGIHFRTGESTLRPESTGTLDRIAALLRSDPGLRLRIEGHTDAVGDPAANQRLSVARAHAVVRDLVTRGAIEEGRLEAAGFGDTRPRASNDTAQGRQENRRVEVVRIEAGGSPP